MAHDPFRLTAFEPIAGFIITCERFADGWTTTIRHRHHAGLFSDCEPDRYSELSSGELVDVLQAVVTSLNAVPGPGDWPDQP